MTTPCKAPRGRLVHAAGLTRYSPAKCGARPTGEGFEVLPWLTPIQCPRCRARVDRAEAMQARREARELAGRDTVTLPLFPGLGA